MPLKPFSIEEAMLTLKCNRDRIFNLIQMGKLKTVREQDKTGSQLRITRASVFAVATAGLPKVSHRSR